MLGCGVCPCAGVCVYVTYVYVCVQAFVFVFVFWFGFGFGFGDECVCVCRKAEETQGPRVLLKEIKMVHHGFDHAACAPFPWCRIRGLSEFSTRVRFKLIPPPSPPSSMLGALPHGRAQHTMPHFIFRSAPPQKHPAATLNSGGRGGWNLFERYAKHWHG